MSSNILRFVARLLVACAMLACASSAGAQGAYPSRPITIVIGFSAGGTTDIIARLISDELRKALGQPIAREPARRRGQHRRRTGGEGQPDGYTLLMGWSARSRERQPALRMASTT
jgi:hypothetical protein